MRVHHLLPTLLFGASALATQLNERFFDNYEALTKRQQFKPSTTTAEGSTCADAFGAGYITCREASGSTNRLCYNPNLGQTCCNSSWACPSGAFCLVQGSCCPTGQSPQSCAAENGLSVSSNFQVPTATGGNGTSVPYATGNAKPTPSSGAVSSSNIRNIAGVAGAVLGAAALL